MLKYYISLINDDLIFLWLVQASKLSSGLGLHTVHFNVKDYKTYDSGKLNFLLSYLQDWSVKYEQDGPVQPRFEINAPDLYIPTMAYVTYVLVAGLVLGMQDRYVSMKQIVVDKSAKPKQHTTMKCKRRSKALCIFVPVLDEGCSRRLVRQDWKV